GTTAAPRKRWSWRWHRHPDPAAVGGTSGRQQGDAGVGRAGGLAGAAVFVDRMRARAQRRAQRTGAQAVEADSAAAVFGVQGVEQGALRVLRDPVGTAEGG